MIAGFEQPDAGAILLDGTDLVAVPPHRRPVNTVFQSYALFPFLDVSDNVAFGLRYQNASKAGDRSRVGAALELVEMGDLRQAQAAPAVRRSAAAGGAGPGARARADRAAARRAARALDAKLRKQLQLELRQLQQRVGTTFVYVTHDQEEALTMSDRLAISSTARSSSWARRARCTPSPPGPTSRLPRRGEPVRGDRRRGRPGRA